jgi:short-subunit dehydrogenase
MAELAVVTGASSGIGRAYAERLARDGRDLLVVARRADRLDELAQRLSGEHGVSVRPVQADLSDPNQVRGLCDEVAGLSVDLLVNNAALAHYMPFAELPPDSAHELVQLNVLTPILLTHAVVGGMRDRSHGAIINLASLLAFSGSVDSPHLPARAVYAGSRAFIVTFTQILAAELKDTGVRVQVVCPGVVRTEFHERQGIDMSAVPRMEPDDVVTASLLDLGKGVVVCVPGLDDLGAWERHLSLERELMAATRIRDLPDRYSRVDVDRTGTHSCGG